MKRSMLAILLATTIAVGGTSTTQALHNTSTTDTLAAATNLARDETLRTMSDDEIVEQKRIELEAKKQEIEQTVAEKRAAISKKLMGVRAERCKAKQENINIMLDTRVAAAQKHFDTFKAIENKLTTLVHDQEIDIENQAALELIMPDLGDNAQLAIEDFKKANFECLDADASAPGAIVKDQVSDTKQALKDYRDAIKNYASAIKTAIDKPADLPAEETDTTEQTTEGAQQ